MIIMSLYLSPNTSPFAHKHYVSSATFSTGVKAVTETKPNKLQQTESTKDRIRKLFDNVQISVSSYDTAWVALVPSPTSSHSPCFPNCVDWLLDNQHSDGSWGLPNQQQILIKDSLSSTLASILALKRWDVGKEQIDRDLNLRIPFETSNLENMSQRRESEIKRAYSEGRKSQLAYISEGVGKWQDWDMVMKYQRRNGSIFNSPSATAAAYMHLKDARCLNYLSSLLEKFGNAVPSIYPLDIYMRLCMIDSLERLGIGRHFKFETTSVLDETYRCWLQGDEEIFLDNATCAMAFRLLRLNGYDISSDHIKQITEEEPDINTALELYRASEAVLQSDELDLEKQNSWCGEFLKQKLQSDVAYEDRFDKYITQEVDYALEFPFYAILDRMGHRTAIEHYNVDSTRVLKTAYNSPNVRNEDFQKLALEDFNVCQSIHQEELKSMERWVVDSRLDKLKFARQKVAYCYYSAAATTFAPELADARISWAKNGVLTTVVDDFFDIGGSMEEMENLIQLLQKWDVDVDVSTECCSEQVEILFCAIHSTISEIGTKAFKYQGRDVTGHVLKIWLDLLKTMFKEAKWANDKYVPTIDEYMENGYVSFALGPIILLTLYFIGPKLSEEVVSSFEYHKLFELVSTGGRLLNDINSYERESAEGKLNAMSLRIISGDKTVNEASKEIRSIITSNRRDLLKMVLQRKESIVPQACKDVFWKMSKVLHFFYLKDDGFTSGHIQKAVKSLIYEPISLSI